MDKIDEIVLNKSASLKDKSSFDEIYNLYYSEIHRYVFKFVKYDDYADDLCQEVFIKVWEKRDNLYQIQSVKAYLYTIAKNHVFDFLRHASVERNVREKILQSSQELHSQVDDTFQSEEYYHHLREVLDSMSLRNQEVFKLCREMDYTYDEAAAVLGISRNAIKKHMVKAMKLLKNSVEKNFGLSFNPLIILVVIFDI